MKRPTISRHATKTLLNQPWVNATEKAIKNKEILYHQLVDLTPEAILVHTAGRIVYGNPGALKLLGAKKIEDLVGLPVMEFVHPDFVDIVLKRIRKIYTSGKHEPLLEEKFIKLDGTVIDVEVTSLPFLFEEKFSILLIIRDITQRKKATKRRLFLEKVSKTLFVSFNESVTLQKVAKLIVPEIADYCRIVTLNERNEIHEIAVNHKDPEKIDLVSKLYEEYKKQKTSYGVFQILQTRKPELISKIDNKVLEAYQTNKKLVAIVNKLGLKSYMGVPLVSRNKTVGAIIFSSVKPNRYYTKDDLSFAQEIGRRVALALDNAKLFRAAQEEIKTRKSTEERLELAQTIGHIGTFEWDMKKKRLYWSKQHEEIYGLPPGSFSGFHEDWEKRVHPHDKRRVTTEVKKKRDTKSGTEFEYRIVRPDKSVRWVHTKSKAFNDESGNPVKRVGVSIDVTEQKKIENNLIFLSEASKLLAGSLDYQTTLNNVAKLSVPKIADWCGIDLLDEFGALQQLAIVHIDPKKVEWAKELRKAAPPQMDDPNSAVARVIKSGKAELYPNITQEMIEKSVKSKKELKLIKDLNLTSVMIVPLYREGVCKGAISFVSAESKRNYDKNDLAMAEELANRASLAIDNAWLYKKSQEAITLRDDFISVASHELKTPITSVKIFTQVLQRHSIEMKDEKANLHLLKMNKQLDKLTNLIYDLLNISKLESGKLDFQKKYFDIDRMIKENVEILQEGIKHKIKINGKLKSKIYGDEDRISQVLINLLSNAIKYSPKADEVIVHLNKNEKEVAVCVQDFGIGLQEEHFNKIFERFYRVFDTTDKTFPGLGIGLYISNEIIKRHNGKIWVESNNGLGSKFFFSLPIKKAFQNGIIS